LAAYFVKGEVMALTLIDPINDFMDFKREEREEALKTIVQQFFAKLHAHFKLMPEQWPPKWESPSRILISRPDVVQDSGIAIMEFAHSIRDQLSIQAHLKFAPANVPAYRTAIHGYLDRNEL
jgi:hypothetical protein